jgi:dTDP-glucose 4,6-dehydratase
VFFDVNVGGTVSLLEVVRKIPSLHFHHISTDEVYGSLTSDAKPFSEHSPYCPNSPYAASKAASDHAVKAYAHTYGISTTLSHCTNNYGPGQHVEKLIPRMIFGCKQKISLPLYGRGVNVRDWIFVDDHSDAVWNILEKGKKGGVYDIGGECEMRNIDLLHLLIEQFSLLTQEEPKTLKELIAYVEDRPGHDFRYAIDSTKIKQELSWRPRYAIKEGLAQTIQWYL